MRQALTVSFILIFATLDVLAQSSQPEPQQPSDPPPSASSSAAASPPETAPEAAPTATFETHYQESVEAYESKDFKGFLAATEKAIALRPDSTRLSYNLACGQALTGDHRGAAQTLVVLAATGQYFDLTAEGDFDPIRETRSYRRASMAMEALLEPVGEAERALVIEAPGALPEGVAWDPATGDLLVGTVHQRTLFRARDGKVEALAGPEDGLWGVFGLAVDPPRRALWICTSAVSEMVAFEESLAGRAALLQIDLKSGEVTRRYPLEPEASEHNCNDLTVGTDGSVYVADSRSGALYVLRSGGEKLAVLVPPGAFRSPNGLALTSDEGALWVADYSRGLRLVDTESGEVREVSAPTGEVLLGIDGLTRNGNRLIAIQNGIRPHRVIALRADAAEGSVGGLEVLLRGHQDFDEPTLGTMVGDHFLLVANSQWGTLAQEGEGKAPVILALDLPE